MSWTWDATSWKKSTKILLLLGTIWPIIYMTLFFAVAISAVILTERNRNPCGTIDVLQLDKKINDGEIKALWISHQEIIATERIRNCKYQVFVTNQQSRDEILSHAKEVVNGKPRVENIDENSPVATDVPNPFAAILPVGFFALMIVHMGTILLMTAQMPFYIVLAVKNDQLEQTMKIVWVILFALVSIFACPVYWYLYIWRKRKETAVPTLPRSDANMTGSV